MIMGIDPGAKGGIAFIGLESIITHVMPDTNGLANLISAMLPEHIFVEKCQAFPGQGISSSFNYGCHFGEILGVIITLRISHTLVQPRQWTKVMHVGAKAADAKKRSLEVSKRLWPKYDFRASMKCKNAHDGMIDAALIAEWGRRQGVNA